MTDVYFVVRILSISLYIQPFDTSVATPEIFNN